MWQDIGSLPTTEFSAYNLSTGDGMPKLPGYTWQKIPEKGSDWPSSDEVSTSGPISSGQGRTEGFPWKSSSWIVGTKVSNVKT